MKIGFIYIVSYTFIMAFKSVIIKLLMAQGFNTVEIMMLRNIITFTVVSIALFIMYKLKKIHIESFKSIAYLLVIGLLGFHISSFLDLYSLNYISVNLERLIVHLYPSLVCLFLVIKNGRQAVTKDQWLAMGIIYLATVVFFGFEYKANEFAWFGMLLAFFAAVFYALYFVLIESSVKKYGGTQATLFSLPLASMTIMGQFIIVDGDIDFDLFGHQTLLLIVVLGGVIGVGSMWLINSSITRFGASNTAIISSLGPFVTAVIAWLILGETLNVYQMFSMGVVVIAMFKLSKPQRTTIKPV
ncbi:DMT family transporter [Marinicellulosiphila megalodicopiae]|uniref:DMT family transporter n=1 Tax=Marinicellulosiphila megalodicopiae TaxID=2724896 RepID=UPI003BAEA77A